MCPSGQYWALGATACRGPNYLGECFNPATAMFQNGCAPGFSCQNNKCNTIPPATFPADVCYVKCAASDEYCENGTTQCRGPNFQGECFNPATGFFQNGCDPGFACANNLCLATSSAVRDIMLLCQQVLRAPPLAPTGMVTRVQRREVRLERQSVVSAAQVSEWCLRLFCLLDGMKQEHFFLILLLALPFPEECTGNGSNTLYIHAHLFSSVKHFLILEFAPSHALPPPATLKMKLTALLSAIAITKLGLLQPASAQTFDGNMTDSSAGDTTDSSVSDCYLPCEGFGEYCEISTGECRGPNYAGECFNPATGAFQDGCDQGFDCVDNKCDFVNTVAPDSGTSVCAQQCDVFGEYCDTIIDECRGPNYDGECFNPVLGYFQNGCEPGYTCQSNQCEPMPTVPSTSVCYLQCQTGEYCENGTDMCRGPNYDGECFNPATGAFQDSCDPGFICVNSECTYA
ncbi:hypothetical protein BBJ28_00023068 [Nothophytophthora sp. Chile5]|nr:hypothetical protein BBJ28_00023068 [Nothophytophthora sp. Chile5]